MTVYFRTDTFSIFQVNNYTRWRVKIYEANLFECKNGKIFHIYNLKSNSNSIPKINLPNQTNQKIKHNHHRYRVLIPDTSSIQINIKRNDVAVFIYIQSPGNMAVECYLRHRLGSGGPDRNHSHPGPWTFVDCLIG